MRGCAAAWLSWALAALLGGLAIGARAQSEDDALRTAAQHPGGTARSNGMVNAFGAVGADPVSISINPAGLALYRSASLSMTMGVEVNTDRSRHYGAATKANQSRLSLPNVALVMTTPGKAEGSFKGAAYGLVYDRTASHHLRTDVLAPRVPGTMLTQFVNQAEGTPYSGIYDAFPFGAALAWDVFGIDTLPGDSMRYFSYIPEGSDTRQRDLIESSGNTSRTGFFYAANLDDRIYLGGSLNIIGHRFKRRTTHTEYSLLPGNSLEQIEFEEQLTTSASGVQINLGALFRATERLRVGAAFHSPQWLALNDAYTTQLRTGFATVGGRGDFDLTATSPDGSFAYRLVTPWRTVLSAAYVAGSNGLVSVDYEYSDLPGMRFRRSSALDDSYDFQAENAAIRDRFRAQHGIRVGTEWRFANWYYRGGWGFVGDPFRKDDYGSGQSRRTYAAGLGYRGEHLTIDFSATYSVQGVRYYPYDATLVEPISIDRSRVSTMVTVALRP